MNAAQRLGLVQSKTNRARDHVATLEQAIREFFDSKPYQVSTKRDSQTRRLIYFVSSVQQAPSSFATITGDVLHNLRSALDHLAYQLFLVESKGSGNGRHVQFPIGLDAKDYAKQRNRRTVGMRKDAIAMLDSIEPYKGGKGHKFWVLQELNNADKHRFLIAIGSNFQSVNIGALMTSELREAGKARDMDIPIIDLYLKPKDTLFPVQVGDALFTDMPDAQENSKIDFRFNIGLSVPNILEGVVLLDTLKDFCDLVSNTVLGFKSCLT